MTTRKKSENRKNKEIEELPKWQTLARLTVRIYPPRGVQNRSADISAFLLAFTMKFAQYFTRVDISCTSFHRLLACCPGERLNVRLFAKTEKRRGYD